MRGWKLGFAILGMIAGLWIPIISPWMHGLPIPALQYVHGLIWAFGGACVGFSTSSLFFKLFSHDLSEHFFCWLLMGYTWLAAVIAKMWCLSGNSEEQLYVLQLFNRFEPFITLAVMMIGLLVGWPLDKIRRKLSA